MEQPQNSNEALAVIRRLTRRQQEVLSAVAIGQDGGHARPTLKRLLELGLIEEYEEPVPGWPPMNIRRYDVPLFVHIAWAEWGSEQPDVADDPA